MFFCFRVMRRILAVAASMEICSVECVFVMVIGMVISVSVRETL
jgi:hypothetical protein